MEKKMNNKGFSLVELIVVIAIMAVLVGVLAPQFIKYVEKSRQSTDLSNLDSIKTVVESYYADKEGDKLPDTVEITSTIGGSYVVTAKKGSNTMTGSGDAAAEQGGVKDTKLKGKWQKKAGGGATPSATWNISNNTWTYAGESDYYSATAASGKSIVAE